MPAILNGVAEDISTITHQLSGTVGITPFPSAAVPADGVSLAEVLRSVWAGLMGTAAGENGIAAFPSAAVPANDVSLAEVIRSIWAATQGTAVGENGIATWPAAAAPGDGISLAEGLRYIVESQIGALTNTGAGADTLTGILGDPASVDFATRLGILQKHIGPSYSSGNYISVTADLTSVTWNSDASHEVFNVTGLVRLQMWITCTGNVGSAGGNAVLMFGHEDDTDAFIAATDETEIDSGDLWYDTTPTLAVDTFGNVVMDYVSNGKDVGYEIDTEACNAGTLVCHCVWQPLNATGNVVAGLGGSLT